MIRDSAEIQKSNIWQQAGKQKQKDSRSSQVQKTFIVVGPASSGKSSFIKIFKSDLDFETKPTNLLEYSYIKKMASKKELIHCYEIATKSLTQIISSLVSKDSFADTVLVICVDLSKPETIIQQTLEWIDILRKEIEKFVNQRLINRQDKYEQLKEQIKNQFSENQDRDSINPMPLNSIIVGCKYDTFQKYDTENRKWLSRALRYIAHHNNMSLFFSSTKNMQVGAQLRSYFQERVFQQKKTKASSQFEYTKPIFINNGDDTIRSMNLPSSGSLNTIQILKKQLGSLFGTIDEKKKEPLDLSKYGQSKIDAVINEKKKQLERIAKMVQKRY